MGEENRDLLPCWLHILTVASTSPDYKGSTLARRSNVTPRTVRTYFQHMYDITGIHDRGVLVMTAVLRGWIPYPDSGEAGGGRNFEGVVRGRLDRPSMTCYPALPG
jgi:Response regulator containing a CheY-like receiver domain and an HTH DNA-binding domain